MFTRCGKLLGGALVLSAVALSLSAFVNRSEAADGPFAGMAGAWSGPGSITINNNKEKLRCRASYVTKNSDSTVDLTISCASDSYKFHLQGGVNYVNGSLNGSWSESAHNAAGTISGSASPGSIRATATGAYFTALLNMTTRGNTQSVSLSAPGTQISSVTITLARSGTAAR
jgi:hypothetical protein